MHFGLLASIIIFVSTILVISSSSFVDAATIPKVTLSQNEYSWTNKVYITVNSPDHAGSNQIFVDISTRGHNLNNYKLVETGTNTGIFEGEVTLTGFEFDAYGDGLVATNPMTSGTGPKNGFIENERDDGITVAFEYPEDTAVVGSALIKWNLGEIYWSGASCRLGEFCAVKVFDPDMNIYPNRPDHLYEILIFSETDPVGIDVTMVEAGNDSGIFEGSFLMTLTQHSRGDRLRVSDGDLVTLKYVDHTLPKPSAIGDTKVVKVITIASNAIVVSDDQGINYKVKFETESTISNVSFDKDEKAFHVDVSGVPNTLGSLTVEIPRHMLDDIYDVIYDGQSIWDQAQVTTTPEKTIISITYLHHSPLDYLGNGISERLTLPRGFFLHYWWKGGDNEQIDNKVKNILNFAFTDALDEGFKGNFKIDIPDARLSQEKQYESTPAGYRTVIFEEGQPTSPATYDINVEVTEVGGVIFDQPAGTSINVHVIPEFFSFQTIVLVSGLLIFAIIFVTRYQQRLTA